MSTISKVVFLKTIKGEDFEFRRDSTHTAIDGALVVADYDENSIVKDNSLKDYILVRQPNSPGRHDWFCKIHKSKEGDIFYTKPEIIKECNKTNQNPTRHIYKDFYLTEKEAETYRQILSMNSNEVAEQFHLDPENPITIKQVYFTNTKSLIIQLKLGSGDEKPYVSLKLEKEGLCVTDLVYQLQTEYTITDIESDAESEYHAHMCIID